MVAKDAGSSAMLRRSATTTRRAQSFLVVPVYFACATRVGASLFGPWFRNKGVREQVNHTQADPPQAPIYSPDAPVAPITASGDGLHMATTGIPATFEIQWVGEKHNWQGWEISTDMFVYVWIAGEDQILIAEVANHGEGNGTLTATYTSDFPGTYLIYVEQVDLWNSNETRRIQNSPFSLTVVGEPTFDADTLPLCGTNAEDVEDSFWRPGTWVSSNVASEAHGVARDGWVFQPKRCVYDTFSRDDLLKLADLEEQTWLLILGNSVFRGLYLTLVDMILRQDQKGDLRSSALQKCWGYADFQVGNLRVTYQDMRLYEFTTVEDSVVCDDDKLSATSSAAFIASCDQFLRSTVFGNDTAGWPKVVVAPSHLVDSDESPNLAIEVVMEALPAAWKGELLFIDHMAGLGRFWKQDNPTMTALHDVNPTPPTLRGHHVREVVGERTTPTESTRDNGIGRMRAYTERDPRVHFMSAFPMYQAKLFENERTRNGMWRFGASVHYHYVLSPKEAKAQGATRMVYSTMTEMIAHVVIGKAVGKKEALYDLYSTTHHPKPRNSQIGDIFQVCTDCPESLIPHHVKPTPEPTCVVAARLLPENQTYPAWNGTLCPSWCMAEQPVDKKQTQSGFVDVRKCSLQNDPPGN